MPAAVPVIGAVAGGLSILSSVKSLFGGTPSAPAAAPFAAAAPAPIVTPPVTMPVAPESNDAAVRQKAAQAAQDRSGRAATVLTSDSGGDKLGA